MTRRNNGKTVLRDVRLHEIPRALPRRSVPVEPVAPPPLAMPLRSKAGDREPVELQVVAIEDAETPAASGEAGYEAGHALGFQQGLEQGLVEAEQRIRQAIEEGRRELADKLAKEHAETQATAQAAHRVRLQQLDRLVAQMEDALSERLQTLEDYAVALTFEALCKLIGEQLADRKAVAKLVAQRFSELRGQTLLRVRMHAQDLSALRETPEGQDLIARAPSVQWLADDEVALGGCVVETAQGQLDARLDGQLMRLKQLWLEVLQRRAAPSLPDDVSGVEADAPEPRG